MNPTSADLTLEESQSDNLHLQLELLGVWDMLHNIVEKMRTEAELIHPAEFKAYDILCCVCGETPRQAVLGKEGRIESA